MNMTSLLNQRLEAVRSIDRSIRELGDRQDALIDILCNEPLTNVIRRELESDYALIDETIRELCVTKTIICDKVNVQAAEPPRPRLVRIK